MQTYTPDFTGTDSGPPSTDAYKRAVYRQPPRNFAVQVLPPEKFGNAYSYGMLIMPHRDTEDRHSIMSRDSGSSGSSRDSQTNTTVVTEIDTSTTAPLTNNYEIWRRWEDCLYFQDLLEVEYGRMAREKRARLQAGKGVKKNGMYMHQDPGRRLQRAASFESLPPGPDPNMIAKDVHELLPRLTKKGTLFKPSKETIDMRGQEFKALIEALLREGNDVPGLIRELRQLRTVRDFFGFWRRDQDRIEKQIGSSPSTDKFSLRARSESVGSRASGIFGSGGMGIYFSPSNLSLQLPTPNIPEPLPTKRSPRRPAFMQDGKGAMNLAQPPPNEAGPSRQPATPRRRAQTLQGTPSTSSSNDTQADLHNPPASAPPNVTFTEALDSGYDSDPTSVARGKKPVSPLTFPIAPATHHTCSSDTSSLSSRAMQSPQDQMEFRFSDIILDDEQRKSVVEDRRGPLIVSFDDGEALPIDEDDRLFVARERGYLVPQSVETRLGGWPRLQDLTIKEEDEREYDDENDEIQYGYAQSDSQPSESSHGHEVNDSAGYLRQPSLPDGVSGARSISNAKDPNIPAWNHVSTSASSARIAAARRDALRSLTGGEPWTPMSARNPASSEPPSARSSVLTMTSVSVSGSGSSSGSTNSGRTNSSDTQSSVDGRPYSYQSSIASCEDIDRTLNSSPFILHSPLLGGDELGNGYSTDRRQLRDSVSSVQTFMTDTSIDAIIPPRPPRDLRPVSPRPVPSSPAGLRSNTSNGVSLMRSNSRGSRSGGIVQMTSVPESQNEEDGVELRDSYFFGMPTPSNGFDQADGLEADDDNGYNTPPRPDGHLPSPTGQSNLTCTQQRAEFRSNANSPVRPTNPSASVSSTVRSISPSPSTATYAPSIVTTLSEESGVNAVSIKVVYGEHIIAFRIDRNSSLADVREKLRHKFVDQQGVSLSDRFTLAYKPPGPGRVQELRRAAGRARSSSVSNVGMTDPGSLRIVFSQRDWLDTVGSCPPGAKVTLHVMNG